ncbi:TrmH family RNA methyltransferase [Corynebacterium kroppenstedtii]|uniref:TrmH family RNA methyltransferase n=1 Tax=Corynebacterium sp. PCR 32 TaxID=3351342 RepID=UPI0030B64903
MCEHHFHAYGESKGTHSHSLTGDRPGQVFTTRTPRIIAARKLLTATGRRKSKKFVVEGYNGVDGALEAGLVDEVFLTESAWEKFPDLRERFQNRRITTSLIDHQAATSLSATVTYSGVFAVCGLLSTSVDVCIRQAQQGRGLVAVAVNMSDPGNAGTFIRTADAVGADCVVFLGESVDIHNGKTVRSSAGSVFRISIGRDRHVQNSLDRFSSRGFQMIATTVDGETSLDKEADLAAHWRARMTVPLDVSGQPSGQELGGGNVPILARSSVWLFGNEAHGLPDDIAEAADYRIRIPIKGSAESFNVSAAAAITLYEASRALGAPHGVATL